MLLCISTTERSEYHLWLTRRFVKLLWGVLVDTLAHDPKSRENLPPDIRNAILGMRHQEAVAASEFSKPHTRGNQTLTSNTGPLLVTSGKLTPRANGITQLTFDILNGIRINFSLTQKLLHALCHVIILSSTKADRGLDLSVGASLLSSEEHTVFH